MEGIQMQFTKPTPVQFAAVLLLVVFLLVPGCTMSIKDKEDRGGDKKVAIDTPIGSLRVREQADVRDIGLPVYPGARRRESKPDDHDSHSANVHISSSLFGLKVVAVEFESDDSPDKIADYYRKELKKFGEVVQCRGKGNLDDFTIDKDSRDSAVTCGKDDKGSGVELKAGTKNNQHVVSIDPNGKGSRFALVYVQARGKGETI
jgi:hypothetical protein